MLQLKDSEAQGTWRIDVERGKVDENVQVNNPKLYAVFFLNCPVCNSLPT